MADKIRAIEGATLADAVAGLLVEAAAREPKLNDALGSVFATIAHDRE